ncbi:MAG: LiaI-LiaF-like domain-containing protein [Terriglobia bacterium]
MGLIPTTITPITPRRRSLTGPVTLIILGLILLLDELVPGWSFGKTWPILLVAIGVIKLLEVSQPPRPPEGPRV